MITLVTIFLLILEKKNYKNFKKFYLTLVAIAMIFDGFIIFKYIIEQNLLEKYKNYLTIL